MDSELEGNLTKRPIKTSSPTIAAAMIAALLPEELAAAAK
jgi:hypothetical protein